MKYYEIKGGLPLEGEYHVKGAKNAALPILAATICKGGVHEIFGCPHIEDVVSMVEILRSLGAKVTWQEDCLVVDSRTLSETSISEDLMAKLRSSVFLMGSLLARAGCATIRKPGGCRIGKRPMDLHMRGLRDLGFQVVEDGEKITCTGRGRGGRIFLPYPSVGATENLMMAALSGNGITVIENCAKEPEIVDLQGFLCSCGYRVHGAGTSVITIVGGGWCHDAMYFIMEDRIEAATYMMALAGTGGNGILEGVREEFLFPVKQVLLNMGVRIKSYEDRMEIIGPKRGLLQSPGKVITAPYPGFPTDCQPQLLTLASVAEGETMIREEIFDNRFTHEKDLKKMGANVETYGKNAIIKGVASLKGTSVTAQDLRGGAALVLAGLMADGVTEIKDIYHIERGYEALEDGIGKLGGQIEKKEKR